MIRLDFTTADNATVPHVKVYDTATNDTFCDVPIVNRDVAGAESRAKAIIDAMRIRYTLACCTPYKTGHDDDPADAIEPNGDDAMEAMNALIADARDEE